MNVRCLIKQAFKIALFSLLLLAISIWYRFSQIKNDRGGKNILSALLHPVDAESSGDSGSGGDASSSDGGDS